MNDNSIDLYLGIIENRCAMKYLYLYPYLYLYLYAHTHVMSTPDEQEPWLINCAASSKQWSLATEMVPK